MDVQIIEYLQKVQKVRKGLFSNYAYLIGRYLNQCFGFIFALEFFSLVSMKNSKPSEEYSMSYKSYVRSIGMISDNSLKSIFAATSGLTRFFGTKIV